MMKKTKHILGIGGIFFKSQDPEGIKNWYRETLGLDTDQYGCTFKWKAVEGDENLTQWSVFKDDTDYLNPSQEPFMINYIVYDLVGLLKKLSKKGVTQVGDIQTYDYGTFAWILDPENRKIELWEPPRPSLEK